MSVTAWWFVIGGAIAVVTWLMVMAEIARRTASDEIKEYNRDFMVGFASGVCLLGVVAWPMLILMVAGWKVWDRSTASYHAGVKAQKAAKAALVHEAEEWDVRAKLNKDVPDIAVAAKSRAKDLRKQAESL